MLKAKRHGQGGVGLRGWSGSLYLATNLADIGFYITVPPVAASGRLGAFPVSGGKVFLFGDTYSLSIRRCHVRTSSIGFPPIYLSYLRRESFQFPSKKSHAL